VDVVVATFKVALVAPPATTLRITPVPVKVELLKDIKGPLATNGDTEAVMVTFPAKPKTLPTVTEEAPEEPAGNNREGLPTVTLKSTVLTVTRKKCFREPLVAVTLTV
jgi:hypothetical protein